MCSKDGKINVGFVKKTAFRHLRTINVRTTTFEMEKDFKMNLIKENFAAHK